MVGVTKLRIKFGPDRFVKTFHNFPDNCSDAKKAEQSMGEDVFNYTNPSKKRGPDELEEVQAKKKQKLDRDLSRKCFTLLRFLMEHQTGWMFNEPVDPDKLKIPDYFSVISKPMDLGTIKSKLLRNVYSSVEEFAADVKLTFSNAMTYNPPVNPVHKIAKELKEIFEVRWESLKKKLSGIEVTEVSKEKPLEFDCSRESSSEKSTSSVELPKPVKEKSEKVSLLSKPLKGQIKKDSSSITPKALIPKLRVKQPDLDLGISSTVKISNKGSAPAAACKCDSCGRITCICLKSCNSSGSELSSLTDCQLVNTPGSQVSESDPHYNGSLSSRNEKNAYVSSQSEIPSNGALFGNELKLPFPDMPPLPPEKALRAATLKAKFAETILKAKHRKVLDQSNKVDLIKIQIEKEQMERAQREEKARIEAEIRDAKIASRMREQTELKEKRQRERLKAEEVKLDCTLDDTNWILEHELINLCGSSNLTRTSLLELGLFLKDDDCMEEMEFEASNAMTMRVDDDLEEGEIS